MKTTVEYKRVSYSNDTKTVKCDLVFAVQINRVQNIENLLRIPAVYSYVSKFADKHGNILMHTFGSATCNIADKFDYETGRRLAFTKAQRNAFNITTEFYDEIIRRATTDILHTSDNCVISSMKCEAHIMDLSGYADKFELELVEGDENE